MVRGARIERRTPESVGERNRLSGDASMPLLDPFERHVGEPGAPQYARHEFQTFARVYGVAMQGYRGGITIARAGIAPQAAHGARNIERPWGDSHETLLAENVFSAMNTV